MIMIPDFSSFCKCDYDTTLFPLITTVRTEVSTYMKEHVMKNCRRGSSNSAHVHIDLARHFRVT